AQDAQETAVVVPAAQLVDRVERLAVAGADQGLEKGLAAGLTVEIPGIKDVDALAEGVGVGPDVLGLDEPPTEVAGSCAGLVMAVVQVEIRRGVRPDGVEQVAERLPRLPGRAGRADGRFTQQLHSGGAVDDALGAGAGALAVQVAAGVGARPVYAVEQVNNV